MSARKRRIKRKIALLVRMDDTRSRMVCGAFLQVLIGSTPAMRYWETCMCPLGAKLSRMGARAKTLAALERNRERRISAGGRA